MLAIFKLKQALQPYDIQLYSRSIDESVAAHNWAMISGFRIEADLIGPILNN